MTRINIVPVQEIQNKQLMAEYHESIRVFSYVIKSEKIPEIPEKYCLGTGHVKFFFDKIPFILERYSQIHSELLKRGFKLNQETFVKNLNKGKLAFQKFPKIQKDWKPSEMEKAINRNRIQERLDRILRKNSKV